MERPVMMVCYVLIASILSLDVVVPVKGQQGLPNFVIVLTDDQDLVLNGMIPLKQTQQLLANNGITFTNAFTTSPICCPSRASLLSGQYEHNHRTHNNSVTGGCYSQHWRDHVETEALPVLLQRNGYETFYAGKYLNQYKTEKVPSGWDHWFGLNGNSMYHNFTLTENGVRRKYHTDYLTDVLKEHSLRFLQNRTSNKPFLAIIAPPAAHAPFTPADRHKHLFTDLELIQGPDFNLPSAQLDKHWLLRLLPARLNQDDIDTLKLINIKRWQTLVAVDELVNDVVGKLIETKRLDNTFVVFTSDNGFHLGQFALGADKRQPYETDIRVPFIIRGPGVPTKRTDATPIALIDLMPTILDLADISKPPQLDGKTFAPNLIKSNSLDLNNESFGRQILVQHRGEGTMETFNPSCDYQPEDNLMGCQRQFSCHCQDSTNNTYVCLREFNQYDNLLYCEFKDDEDFVELYDVNADPHQIHNLAYSMLPSELARLSLALEKAANCEGVDCHDMRY